MLATFAVNEVFGLSGVACCYSMCPLFLTMSANRSVGQRRALLKDHLWHASALNVPGFHQGVLARGSDMMEAMDGIVTGQVLQPPLPTRAQRRGGPAPKALEPSAYEERLARCNGMQPLGLCSVLLDFGRELRDRPDVEYARFKVVFDDAFARL